MKNLGGMQLTREWKGGENRRVQKKYRPKCLALLFFFKKIKAFIT